MLTGPSSEESHQEKVAAWEFVGIIVFFLLVCIFVVPLLWK